MRKFEVGDRVIVRKNFWKDTPSKYLDQVGVAYEMKSFSGQTAKIVRCWKSHGLGERLYNIDIDSGEYSWASDWLEHVEVEVREGDDL